MPVYEYECSGCKYKFEELQNINDDPLKTCPKCGGETLKKLVSYMFIQTLHSPKEHLEKIKEESKKDARDIQNGNMEKASDYLGENDMLKYYGTK